MSVLDAQAVIAFLRAEAASDEVEDLVRSPTTISSVNLAEVVDHLGRVQGWDDDVIDDRLARLRQIGLGVQPLTEDLAVRAGRLRAKHYRPRTSRISMSDCAAAAVALSSALPLATSDRSLAALVRAEGGEIIALPDSRGVRPSP